MKLTQAIIFFGIVFVVYGLINFYILRRALPVVSENYRTLALYVSLLIVLTYFLGRILENFWISHLSDLLVWVGSFWLAVMFYTLLFLLFIDLLRLINHFIPFFPSIINKNPDKAKLVTTIVISMIVFIIVAAGFINTKIINIRHYNLHVHKNSAGLKRLNIVMASDLHLGTINGKMFAYKIVDKINKLKPDVILLAGDIIDEDIMPVLRDNVGDALLELKAKYGVYGITGNHEYIGGVKDAVAFLESHNITMLRDTSLLINNSFYLAGREDRAINQFSNNKRKPLSEVVKGIDNSKPVILMDHQPFNLSEAEQNSIDLQFSGHTHNGQLWPLNYIVEKVYELAWGYKKINNTHYYVSCGVGGWGPPVRTGSRPEIINIKMYFDK